MQSKPTSGARSRASSQIERSAEGRRSQPSVLAIDDDRFYLNEMALELEGKARYKGFLGPNDFEDEVNEEDIASADAILVDYDFGRGNAVQSSLAKHIRENLGFKGRVILWSLHDHFSKGDQAEIAKDYDAVMSKKGFNWEKLSRHLAQPEPELKEA